MIFFGRFSSSTAFSIGRLKTHDRRSAAILSAFETCNTTVNAVPSEQVFSLSQIHPEDILDTSKVRETLEAVGRLYAANGYPTASVVPQVQVHEAGHWVSLRFSVVEGARSP